MTTTTTTTFTLPGLGLIPDTLPRLTPKEHAVIPAEIPAGGTHDQQTRAQKSYLADDQIPLSLLPLGDLSENEKDRARRVKEVKNSLPRQENLRLVMLEKQVSRNVNCWLNGIPFDYAMPCTANKPSNPELKTSNSSKRIYLTRTRALMRYFQDAEPGEKKRKRDQDLEDGQDDDDLRPTKKSRSVHEAQSCITPAYRAPVEATKQYNRKLLTPKRRCPPMLAKPIHPPTSLIRALISSS